MTRAAKRAFLSSCARLIGVVLGAGAGSLLKQLVGDGLHGWAVAAAMAGVGFILMFLAEREKEIT